MAEKLAVITSPAGTAQENMAIDTALFEGIKKGICPPTLRLYTWGENATTTGYSLFNSSLLTPDSSLVKRPTGGGIVYHKTEGELTIAFTHYLKRGQPILELYRKIHESFIAILSDLNFNTELLNPSVRGAPCATQQPALECFPNPTCHDIVLAGKKIMGGGLRVGGKCFLYQGTLKLPNLKQEDFLETLLQNQTFQNNWGMPIMKIVNNVV